MKITVQSFRSVTLVLAAAVLSACATGENAREARAESVCAQCGEIVDLRRADRRSVSRAEQPLTSGSPRLLQPQPLGASGLLQGDAARPLAMASDVPVYEVQRSTRLVTHYEVDLRMDDGRMESLLVDNVSGLRVGERVRIVGNRLLPEASSGR